ncbi:DUF6233 domain-containing protein [Streptomyces sp. CB02261]|uniref:DUF6233 domain-containing protein n=1 Tax=Streptomyces sp. CB02261 TaxID=1703940 RepID=UPI000ACA3C10|nr:DUF6233 domain-containing protein [Streptomyces sp. CB02261]
MEMPIADRLEKQRTLRDWLRWQLDQADRTIRELEAQQEQERRRREVARREMSWKVLPSRAVEGHPVLHRGNCSIAKNMPSLLSKEEVRMTFEEFPGLEMCELCAPWGSLGIDKPPARQGRSGGKP